MQHIALCWAIFWAGAVTSCHLRWLPGNLTVMMKQLLLLRVKTLGKNICELLSVIC